MQFQEHERVFTVLDDVPLGFFALNKDYEIIFWNRQMEYWTGIPREDVLHTPIGDRFAHLTRPRYTTRLAGVFEGGPPVVFSSQLHHHIIPVPHKADTLRVQHTTVTPVTIPGSELCHALFSIQDVTEVTQRVKDYSHMRNQALAEVQERKKTEQRLRESETELRALFAAMPELILLVDREIVVRRLINAGEFVNWLRTDQLVGKSVHDLLPADLVSEVKSAVERAFAEDETIDVEYMAHLRRGDFWVKASFSPVDDDNVICVVRNISEDRLAQQRTTQLAIEREKSELVGDFIQAASHDFRTSLSVMNTNLYLLERSKDDEKRAERRVKLKEQVNHLEELVDSLLTIYRWDTTTYTLKPGRFQVQGMLNNLQISLTDRANDKGITLKFVPTDVELPIHADEVELTRALRSLVENALHFTQEGSITVFARTEGHALHLVVEDTGIGIHDDEHTNIFKLFYKVDKARTHQLGGLGLGLSIAERIIKAHQGRIDVSSTPGEGSRFSIVLPAALDTSVTG